MAEAGGLVFGEAEGAAYEALRQEVERLREASIQTVKELAEARRERDEARTFGELASAEYHKLVEETKRVWCAYCGAEYPEGTPRHGDGALAEHIRVCPEHPMRRVEAALKVALTALPDSRTGGPEGTGYRWLWDECTEAEQAWVKQVRAEIEVALGLE